MPADSVHVTLSVVGDAFCSIAIVVGSCWYEHVHNALLYCVVFVFVVIVAWASLHCLQQVSWAENILFAHSSHIVLAPMYRIVAECVLAKHRA
jgi:hypothetical protein